MADLLPAPGQAAMTAGRLARSTALLLGVTLAVRLLGLVREQLVAAVYGTGPEADAFSVVANLLTLALGLFGGAFAAVVIPSILRLQAEHRSAELRRLLGGLFSYSAAGAALAGLALFLFAQPLVHLYVPGFSPAKQELVVRMIRVAAPALAAVALSAFFAALLHARGRFSIPSLGPALASGGVILAALLFARRYGPLALMAGMALGYGLHLALLSATAWRGLRFRPTFAVTRELAGVGRRAMPLLLSAAVFHLNAVVDRTMASMAGDGVAAALGYAARVACLPLGLLLGPFVIPFFPLLAETAGGREIEGRDGGERDRAALRRLLDSGFRLSAILILPVTVTLLLFAGPIVELFFQRGVFGRDAARQTTVALLAYAFLLFPFALRDLATRAFYALHDTWTPVLSNLLMVATNVTLMVALVPRFGIVAIAGSTSVATAVGCLHLQWTLRKRVPAESRGRGERSWPAIGVNLLCFSALAWGSHALVLELWPRSGTGGAWGQILALGAGCTVAGLGYLLLTLRLETQEIDWLRRRLGALLPGRHAPSPRPEVREGG